LSRIGRYDQALIIPSIFMGDVQLIGGLEYIGLWKPCNAAQDLHTL